MGEETSSPLRVCFPATRRYTRATAAALCLTSTSRYRLRCWHPYGRRRGLVAPRGRPSSSTGAGAGWIGVRCSSRVYQKRRTKQRLRRSGIYGIPPLPPPPPPLSWRRLVRRISSTPQTRVSIADLHLRTQTKRSVTSGGGADCDWTTTRTWFIERERERRPFRFITNYKKTQLEAALNKYPPLDAVAHVAPGGKEKEKNVV